MSTYILHGGATSRKTPKNEKYFLEMTKDLLIDATILCVYFSREKDRWPELFEQDKINFSSVASEKKFNFILADEDTDIFVEQINKADLVYLRGGDTERLEQFLNKVDNLKQLFSNKIISGSSAGAYVLSTYYYSNSKDEVCSGLGILPIKVFCHYTEDKKDTLELLQKFRESLEVVVLSDEEFAAVNR